MPRVDLTDEDRQLVERVRACFERAKAEHDVYRKRWDEWYALYRVFQEFRENHRDAPDRDVMSAAKREWGADLHTPVAFRTVETVSPRITGHRLASYIQPRDKEALGNVDNMRLVIDAQEEQCRYKLVQQDVSKDGLMYGLGVQQTYWRTKQRTIKTVGEGTFGAWVEHERQESLDDAWAEWVNPLDFLWDPFGHDLDTLEYLFKRTWRSDAYIAKRFKTQQWRTDLLLEDLLSGSGPTKIDEVWDGRRRAEGMSAHPGPDNGRHEVWEFWTGSEIITILDGEIPVVRGENNTPDGTFPFQTYRPTSVSGRLVGIGEIEPIVDLVSEMDTARGQRRDAATMALGRGYAFDESMVDPDDLKIGPNLAIPVNGSPRDFLFPLPIADVPNSGYQETAEIKEDIDATSGVSEDLSGGASSDQTATGAQLSHQSASRRIDQKRDRFVQEIIIPTAEKFVLMNQARIVEPREIIEPDPSKTPAWQFRQIGPKELAGRMAIKIDDDASKAENVPQDRNDAQIYMGLLGNPLFNQEKVGERLLELSGVKQPKGWVIAEQQVPVSQIEAFFKAAGIDPRTFAMFLDQQEGGDDEAQPQDAAPPQG